VDLTTLPRGMVFIDLPNITSGGHAYGNIRFKFPNLAKVLTEGTRNVGIHAYVVNKGSRQELFREIDRSGINVVAVSPGKSVDGRLIFDLIVGALSDTYDIAILASGDRDYVRVVQKTHELHKSVWIASFEQSIALSLRAQADKFIKLDDHFADISFTKELFDATCADCGKPCKVPFKPVTGAPVYCLNCLPRHRK
jgi:CxxC-x17-CxxC domain-containing protein